MSLIKFLTKEFGNIKANDLLNEIIICHDLIVEDCHKFHSLPYPFFNFISHGEIVIAVIFNSEKDIIVHALKYDLNTFINETNTMAMQDTVEFLNYLNKIQSGKIFTSNISIAYLRNNI